MILTFKISQIVIPLKYLLCNKFYFKEVLYYFQLYTTGILTKH